MTIWKASISINNNYKGTVGRVLLIDEEKLIVQCGFNTSLWIEKFEVIDNSNIKIGDKLGSLHNNKLDELINNLIWNK